MYYKSRFARDFFSPIYQTKLIFDKPEINQTSYEALRRKKCNHYRC